jgi:hypothetical protein
MAFSRGCAFGRSYFLLCRYLYDVLYPSITSMTGGSREEDHEKVVWLSDLSLVGDRRGWMTDGGRSRQCQL